MATNYQAVARQAAAKYGIPVGIFLRQIGAESGWDPNAHSGAGAIGIAQFMPRTAAGFGINPNDPVQSLFAAARYDRQGVDKYGSIARALSAYNSGKPDAYLDPKFAGGQTYDYVRKILGGAPQATNAGAGAPPSMAPVSAPAPAPAVDTSALRASALQSLIGQVGAKTPDYSGFLGDLGQIRQAQAAPAPKPQLGVQVAHDGPVSPNAVGVVKLASKYVQAKTPYKWGGTTPAGFDCSGFVQYLYAQKGVKVPRTTYEQFKAGTAVARGALQPGDVVFFEPSAQGPGHEALYIGHGQVVAAPHTGTVVQIQKLDTLAKALGYVGARRLG